MQSLLSTSPSSTRRARIASDTFRVLLPLSAVFILARVLYSFSGLTFDASPLYSYNQLPTFHPFWVVLWIIALALFWPQHWLRILLAAAAPRPLVGAWLLSTFLRTGTISAGKRHLGFNLHRAVGLCMLGLRAGKRDLE
jgi:hypothetical protein